MVALQGVEGPSAMVFQDGVFQDGHHAMHVLCMCCSPSMLHPIYPLAPRVADRWQHRLLARAEPKRKLSERIEPLAGGQKDPAHVTNMFDQAFP